MRDRRITLRLNEQEWRELDIAAKTIGLSRPEVLRALLASYFFGSDPGEAAVRREQQKPDEPQS